MRSQSQGTKRWIAAAVAVTSVAAVVGCSSDGDGSTSGDGGDVVLELWDTDTRPERTANLETLIDMFEAENPGITVEYLGLPTDSYMQKISTAISTNSTPDLLTPKASDISALVAQGALETLDDMFAAGGWDEKIDPVMVESTRAAAPDGNLYITPATALVDVLYYRADWLEDAGVDVPQSWDDFENAVAAMTDASSGTFGYTIRGGSGFFAGFMDMVYTRAGIGDVFDADGTSTLDDPAIVKATQEYVDLYKATTAESDLTADFKVMIAQFSGGGAGTLTHSIGSYPTILEALEPDQVAVTLPYAGENGTQVISQLTTGFGMFASSEHKEAAQKFLEFTMGEEGNSFWAEASGYMPGNIAVADEPWVSESKALAAAAEARSSDSATPLNVPYYLPEWSSITGTDMLPDWQSVLQGNMSVEDFCAKYATALTEAQERYEEAMK